MKSLEHIISKTKKSLKRLAYAGLVSLALAGGVRGARADSYEHYFPLYVGNSWTYVNSDDGSIKTFTIIGTEEIRGDTYYKFDDYFSDHWEGKVTEGHKVGFRYDPVTNRILMLTDGKEIIRYNWGDLDTWNCWDSHGLGLCRLKEYDVTCNVPSGEFNDCINFQFMATYCGPDAYGFGEYLAPNVGNIKYVVPGGEFLSGPSEGDLVTFELQNYTIIPEPGSLSLFVTGLPILHYFNKKKKINN